MKKVVILVVLLLLVIVLLIGGKNQKIEDSVDIMNSENVENNTQEMLYKGNLSLSVSVSPKVLTSNEIFNITLRLKNVGAAPVRGIAPMRWISLSIEIYFENGTKIKYTGPRPSLLPPTDENLKVLQPGEEIVGIYRFSWGRRPEGGKIKDWYFPWEGRYRVVVTYNPNVRYSRITLPYWKEKTLKAEDWFEVRR
ncbi:hypothetical protein VFC49_01160 [Thermococcus sp. SY098]|uniref:hypothetical protein n=1 Tax=Thermococcus sp. SY098 TaxID=3111325 RepID=UPI002D780310|nr:hypothetical protein [Thermococcus sp. SY098]WRS52804.1 hypothetical protein VFC49_01160 [Thermococcus sp. SY098]